jgi:anamorsin
VKPKGKIILDGVQLDEVKSKLTLTGFINISTTNNKQVVAEKPNYEVGSSAKLSFASKIKGTDAQKKEKIAAVWKIDNDDDEEIDPDDLLDEEDKQKPDPSTLKGEFNGKVDRVSFFLNMSFL